MSRTLVVERCPVGGFLVRDGARRVAREIFRSEQLCRPSSKGGVELTLSVANFSAAASAALSRGESVEVLDDGKVVRRASPGDRSGIADELRRCGRGGLAEDWLRLEDVGMARLGAVLLRKQGATVRVGLAVCSVVGKTLTLFSFDDDSTLSALESMLAQGSVKEALVAEDDAALAEAVERSGAVFKKVDAGAFSTAQRREDIVKALGEKCGTFTCEDDSGRTVLEEADTLAIRAGAALLTRLHEEENIFALQAGEPGDRLIMDVSTMRALSVVSDVKGAPTVRGLLATKSRTLPGSRRLEDWLRRPLFDLVKLQKRQNSVAALVSSPEWRQAVRLCLGSKACKDLEGLALLLVGKKRASLSHLVEAYRAIAKIEEMLNTLIEDEDCEALWDLCLSPLRKEITALKKLRLLVEEVVEMTASSKPRVRPSLSEELEALEKDRSAAFEALQAEVHGFSEKVFPSKKRKKTTDEPCKLEHHDARHWVMRVTKTNAARVKKEKIEVVGGSQRKADLLFTTEAVSRRVKRAAVTKDAYDDASSIVVAECLKVAATYGSPLRRIASICADLDAIQALATAALDFEWCRPKLLESEDSTMELEGLRHCLVERALEQHGGSYISSDLKIGGKEEKNRLWLITGPNMGGKSTLVRAAALVAVMAQAGSYVPCASATLGLVDRVLARVGASDDPRAAESTFLREMRQTAQILKTATDRSFVCIDEVGRGTSTRDGTAIAKAVAEHLATKTRSLTLFTTHFASLASLENTTDGAVVNYHVDALESPTGLTLLYQLQRGASAKSFGIHCAALAKLPTEVIDDAKKRANALGATLPSSAA